MASARIESVNLWPALLQFSIAYLLLSALVTGLLIAFNIDSNTGLSIGLLMAAAIVGARKFVIDYERPMRRGEQVRFALWATAATMAVTLIQVAVVLPLYVSTAEMPQLIADGKSWAAANAGLLAIISLVVLLLTLLMLYVASGIFSRMFDKRRIASGKI